MLELHGRPVVDRTAMVACGIGKSTINAQYTNRAETGFPEKAGTVDRVDYWYADEWEAWFRDYQDRKRAALTDVDRSGEAGDLVDAAEAARIMGYNGGGKVITSNVRLGYFPQADAYEGKRPRWKRSTVWAAADARTGMGSPRTGTRKARPPKTATAAPYADDPRVTSLRQRMAAGEQLHAEVLAAEYGVSVRTAERLLRAAREPQPS